MAKRVHGPAQVSNAATTKYTVPAGMKAIIRHIATQNPSASPIDFTFSIGADAAATRIRDGFSIGADQPYDYFPYIAMTAGEILQAFSSAPGNILTLTITVDEEVA